MKSCIAKLKSGDTIVVAMTDHHFKLRNSAKTHERPYVVVRVLNGCPVIISQFTLEPLVMEETYHSAIVRIIKK